MSVLADNIVVHLDIPKASTDQLLEVINQRSDLEVISQGYDSPSPQPRRPAPTAALAHACAVFTHGTRGERWRRPGSPRRCTGTWAAGPLATCTSLQRIRFCCWTLSRRRWPSSRGARRARVLVGQGLGVLKRRRRRRWLGQGKDRCLPSRQEEVSAHIAKIDTRTPSLMIFL